MYSSTLTNTAVRRSSSMISSLTVPFGLQADFTTVLCFKLSEKGRRIPCVLDDINFFTESFLCSTGLGYLPPLSSSLFKEPLLVCFIDVSVSWKGSQDIDLPSHANFKSWFVKGFVTDSGKWHSLHSDMAFRKNCSPLIFGVRLQIALNHYDPK